MMGFSSISYFQFFLNNIYKIYQKIEIIIILEYTIIITYIICYTMATVYKLTFPDDTIINITIDPPTNPSIVVGKDGMAMNNVDIETTINNDNPIKVICTYKSVIAEITCNGRGSMDAIPVFSYCEPEAFCVNMTIKMQFGNNPPRYINQAVPYRLTNIKAYHISSGQMASLNV